MGRIWEEVSPHRRDCKRFLQLERKEEKSSYRGGKEGGIYGT